MASLRELDGWLSPYAGWLYDYLRSRGLHPRVTSVYRSRQQQAVLYARYQSGKSAYPVAPPGASYHEYRRAFDMVCDNNAEAGRIWRLMGGSWWASDPIHFQA